MNKTDQINKLKKKLKELQDKAGDDVNYSYREAVQTEEMMKYYQKRIQELENSDENFAVLAEYQLHDTENNEKIFTVVSSDPDPSAGKITADSPLGAKLLASKVGDTISLGPNEYKVVKIS
jgi:transcription elongation GreA/GreB family factor